MNPLSFGTDNDDGYEEPLTVDIARSWLTHGVPTCEELVRRHGLRKWGVMSRLLEMFEARARFVRHIGFGIPSREAIDLIAKSGPVLEVGCGTGFWSSLITKAGGDIIACDSESDRYDFCETFHPILKADATEIVRSYPNRNVLMVWPCYKQDWGARVAEAMKPGQTLFLVSEGRGGCIGDDRLFGCLAEQFEEMEHDCFIPVWPSIGDYLSVHVKRG